MLNFDNSNKSIRNDNQREENDVLMSTHTVFAQSARVF